MSITLLFSFSLLPGQLLSPENNYLFQDRVDIDCSTHMDNLVFAFLMPETIEHWSQLWLQTLQEMMCGQEKVPR